MTMATEAGIRTPDVCALTGVTYRQLDFWARTDLVRPSVQEAHGSGSARLYSAADIVLLVVIRHLLNHGISLQSVRCVVEPVRYTMALGPNEALWLVLGEHVEVTAVLEPVIRRQGVSLFTVLDLARVIAETTQAVTEWQKTRQFSDEHAD